MTGFVFAMLLNVIYHVAATLGLRQYAPGVAAKLARLVYRMMRYGMRFVDRGAEFYEAQHRRRQIDSLKRKAANLGLKIIAAPAA